MTSASASPRPRAPGRRGRGAARAEYRARPGPAVDRPRQCVVDYRTLNVRNWERIVSAWEAGARVRCHLPL
ncbi:hypothetical protein CAC01_00110 [Streptomyces sp. CLI2509]|nr:hypothetical protein CAC01_00110 [Streptomyces sp. CLI2509]